jgi:hypothetical protein
MCSPNNNISALNDNMVPIQNKAVCFILYWMPFFQ